MRKPTKSSLTRKLDKLFSQIVRKRGKCAWCGTKEGLECCHIFSRKYRSLRWSLDNAVCMCHSHHFYSHSNPILFAEFVKNYLGEEKYELLKEARNQITKLTLEDLQIKLKTLEELK